jgi:hypothetical protein
VTLASMTCKVISGSLYLWGPGGDAGALGTGGGDWGSAGAFDAGGFSTGAEQSLTIDAAFGFGLGTGGGAANSQIKRKELDRTSRP